MSYEWKLKNANKICDATPIGAEKKTFSPGVLAKQKKIINFPFSINMNENNSTPLSTLNDCLYAYSVCVLPTRYNLPSSFLRAYTATAYWLFIDYSSMKHFMLEKKSEIMMTIMMTKTIMNFYWQLFLLDSCRRSRFEVWSKNGKKIHEIKYWVCVLVKIAFKKKIPL